MHQTPEFEPDQSFPNDEDWKDDKPTPSIIKDRHGKEFQVFEFRSEWSVRFNLECKGRPAGYANCMLGGDEVLYLADLRIYEETLGRSWFFIDLVFWSILFPPARWRVINYQNRGLGTAMIEFLATYARSNSFKRIEGEIKAHDFKKNPRLPEWYRDRGFKVCMNDGKSGSVVAAITLNLP